MNFIIYDIFLLILFALFASIFLYKNRVNLKKEGILFLYKTKWGIKLIDYIGEKYKSVLNFLSYISIGFGYILMTGMLFILFQTVYLYLTTSISQVIKIPPVAPLIPYFPKLFGLQSLFPPFYFIYFLIALLIVATVHEFSHGIFARKSGIKIKSTGFAFFKYFPAFFGAFVEQDEQQMEKSKKFDQMGVLSAGVFANIIAAILFYVILFWFFSFAFTASGITFNTYAYEILPVASITSVNGVILNNPSIEEFASQLKENETFNKIHVEEKNYVGVKSIGTIKTDGQEISIAALYYDSPAINSNLSEIIREINNVKIDSIEKLQEELEKYSPGEEIEIMAIEKGVVSVKEIILTAHPENEEVAWLGIGFINPKEGILNKIIGFFPSYKKPNVYYEPNNNSSVFIKDFLWWIFVINLLVALFNMLPVGILDGGRFFYLTVLGITKSEKIAKRSFKIMTQLILLLFIAIMIKWVFSFL